ncbi:MAG: TonB-dependent receptor, partial [Bacteroidales bacterium]|nr:TonB-dependent receptor [Bacteroidales bacterium]
MNLKNYICCFFLFFLTINVLAQEPEEEVNFNELLNMPIEELLDLNINLQVSSNTQKNLFSSPSTVTVINKETLLNYNFQTVSEAVKTVAGMMVTRTYLKKNIPTARGVLQDHYANKILILVNGVPTFNSITGEGILDRISIHSLERIEILKGPASVLYGTNAYAGAINLILRNKSENLVEAHSGLGYFNLYNSGANLNVKHKRLNLFVSGNSYQYHRKHTTYLDENGESGEVDDLDINNDFTLWSKYGSHQIFLNGYNMQEGFLGVGSTYASGAGIPQKLFGYLTNYQFNKEFSEKLNLGLMLSNDWNQRQIARDRSDSIQSLITGYRLYGNLVVNYKLNKHLTLEAGSLIDFRKSVNYNNFVAQTGMLISNNNLKNKNVTENSHVAQINFEKDKFSSTAGIRYTINSNFGGNFTPRLSTVYRVNKSTSIKAMYGESFKAPTLFELFFLNPDSTVFGNEQLDPEKNHSLEIAFLKQFNHFFLQVLAYGTLQENKIERMTTDVVFQNKIFPNQLKYTNLSDFYTTGLEWELKYNNPKIAHIFLNYNYCRGMTSSHATADEQFNYIYIPNHQYTLGINKKVKKGFSTSVLLNGWTATNGPLAVIDAQNILDVNFTYQKNYYKYKFSHTIGIKNLFNERIEVPE